MRVDFPASDALASIVKRGFPGVVAQGADQSRFAGGRYRFKLALSSGEEQDFFEVAVVVEGEVARITVWKDGDSASGEMPAERLGLPGDVTVGITMAYETIPTMDGRRECQLCTASGNGISFMAWVDSGIAYRTIHESAGYRLCLDLSGLE